MEEIAQKKAEYNQIYGMLLGLMEISDIEKGFPQFLIELKEINKK